MSKELPFMGRFHVKYRSAESEIIVDILEIAAERGLQVGPRVEPQLLCAAEWLAGLARASGISGYDSPIEALQRGLMPALAYFGFPEAPRCGRVAELGAGAGALGAGIAILEQNVQVILVDRSKRALTACELLAARLKLPNLTVVEMDLALDAGAVDVYDAVVFRALAPGGEALSMAQAVVRTGGFIAGFHQEGDPAFSQVGERGAEIGLRRIQVLESGVPGLVVTGFTSRAPTCGTECG